MDADAIVVGAGPGGASAAYHLARQGRHVLLLDRERFPRDKSCGDGLTRFSTRLLAEMGLLEHLPLGPPACGARVIMRGRGSRDFRYPPHLAQPSCGTVIPRRILDASLCRHAVAHGAELWEKSPATRLRYEGERVVGVDVERDGKSIRLHAPVVIAADGAGSRLAYQAGLAATPRRDVGYAIRGYYDGIEGLGDLLEIYMPLFDPSDRYLLPSYGWVFAVGTHTANIGVGLVSRQRGADVRELMHRFVEWLRRDPRFEAAREVGRWKGAPLRFDFAPERCSAPGLLLVGDAAGMISPFTGEGIGYALESGRLAAETILTALHIDANNALDLGAYPAALGRRFAGYFQTGRESATRFKFVWHVLESTFHNDRPLFDICRRAALFPEGLGQTYSEAAFEDVTPYVGAGNDVDSDDGHHWGPLRADLFSVGEVLITTVGRDWPFLAQMLAAEQFAGGIPFRPALLLLLAGYLWRPQRGVLVPVAAAVELGYLAAVAHTSVGEDDGGEPSTDGDHEEAGGRRANWGNTFALLVGDFLLSRAYMISAAVSPGVSRAISASLARACEGYVLALRNAFNPDLTPDEYLAIAEKKTATLFELPCRLGAQLSGASPRVASALSVYGRSLGVAYQLADDALAADRPISDLSLATRADPHEGIYGLPIIYALQSDRRAALRAELTHLRQGNGSLETVYAIAQEAGGFARSRAAAIEASEGARAALRDVPPGPAQRALSGLVDYVVRRVG